MSAAPKKKVVKKAAHPMYKDMIASAITALANRSGSSKLAISKYIVANYSVGDRHETNLKSALKRGLAGGALVKKSGLGCAGSFKLAKPVPAPKKKAAPKKKVAPKKKPAAKKAAKKGPAKKKAATPKKKATTPKKKAASKKKGTPLKKKKPTTKKKPSAKKAK